PMESRQESELGAAAARAGLRGRVRSHAGLALSARRAVRALAPGQATRGVPLRSAGGHAGLRARACLRRARLARPVRAAPGIVVGVGRLLGGTLVLRNVTQVDPDARPRARAAAHRVDENVV